MRFQCGPSFEGSWNTCDRASALYILPPRMADFTCVWTAEGWLSVAAVIDLFSRVMSDQMTSQSVTDDLIKTL